MKRKLFIGSSKEGLNIAETIKSAIEEQCSDWIEVNLWNGGDVFTLNTSTLDSLIKTAMQYDYAILVASGDDRVRIRRKRYVVARDNVIFEAGLFLGALGKNRTFMVVDKRIKIPTDYDGITRIQYEKDKLTNVTHTIISSLRMTRNSSPIKSLPSAALALGYFENYVLPFCSKEEVIKLKIIVPTYFEDINRTIDTYIGEHLKSINTDLFSPTCRPTGRKYEHKSNEYWDIPTTLQIIRKLLDMLMSKTEIGKVSGYNEWLERELRCFGETLSQLIQQDDVCKNIASVEYL